MKKRLFHIMLILCSVSVHAGSAMAQQGGRYYPETGHTLDARFVTFFDAHGGVEILGYPITDVFVDPENGFPVQYTENARLEQVRQGAEATIRLPVLGELLGGWEAPLSPGQGSSSTSSGCRFYPESGHRICFAFLDFFERHGGSELFGYPISEFKIENGRVVQYFQRFRLDWHPEAAAERQIQVAALGREHFDSMGYDPNLLKSNPPEDLDQYRVLELRPSVSVWKPVTRTSDTQRVFVVVRDQNLMPVQGAWVTLNVKFTDHERVLVMEPTDAAGVSQLDLSFEQQPPGKIVILEVLVSNADIQVSTRDSFLVWW
jgi:hypothetical protein